MHYGELENRELSELVANDECRAIEFMIQTFGLYPKVF